VLSPDQVLVKNASPALLSAPSDLLRLVPQDCGWRGWGEISYAGASCVERASAADHLVRTWLEESYPGTSPCILSYEIGQNGLQVYPLHDEQVPEIVRPTPMEVRLRMDGLFEQRVHAIKFTEEFEALYTNGPAGGGGIRYATLRSIYQALMNKQRKIDFTLLMCILLLSIAHHFQGSFLV